LEKPLQASPLRLSRAVSPDMSDFQFGESTGINAIIRATNGSLYPLISSGTHWLFAHVDHNPPMRCHLGACDLMMWGWKAPKHRKVRFQAL
jgi:hypothetical protein